MMFKYEMDYEDFVMFNTATEQPQNEPEIHIYSAFQKNASSISPENLKMSQDYSKSFVEIIYNKEKFKDAQWIKVQGTFMNRYIDFDLYRMHHLICEIKRNSEILEWKSIGINNKIGLFDNRCFHEEINLYHKEDFIWDEVYFYVKIPDDLQNGDTIKTYIWNNVKNGDLWIKNLELEFYK